MRLTVLACAALPWVAATAAADYPTRPIRVLVLNAPGSGADILTRLIGNHFTEAFKQQVVVDNRPGGGGNVGAEMAMRAAPDGHTLMMVTSQQPIVVAMYPKLNYDLLRDFTPINLAATAPFILVVHLSVAASSVKELVALAKGKPGNLRYGSAGSGSSPHLATELFKHMIGTDMLQVPYKGTSPILVDVMAGHIQLGALVAPLALPAVKSGRVRALGVTSLKHSALAPEIPAVAETVPGYEWTGWYGLVAPAGTPAAIIAKLNAEQNTMLKSAEFKERLAGIGAEPLGSTPQQ